MRKNPKPRKTRADAMPDEDIAQALIAAKGLQCLAAEMLHLEQSTVSDRIKESPYLQKVREEAVERRLDKAELELANLVDDKCLGAICFLLKTRGKERGYTEGNYVAVPNEIFNMFNAQMTQITALQSDRKNAANNK